MGKRSRWRRVLVWIRGLEVVEFLFSLPLFFKAVGTAVTAVVVVLSGIIAGALKSSFGAALIGAGTATIMIGIAVGAVWFLPSGIKAKLLSALPIDKRSFKAGSQPTPGNEGIDERVITLDEDSTSLRIIVEKPKIKNGFEYVFHVRNQSLSSYQVSSKLRFLYGSQMEITGYDADAVDLEEITLPVAETYARSAPLDSGNRPLRFLFARQILEQVQIFSSDTDEIMASTSLINTAISPENGKRIECEVQFMIGSLDHHSIEGIGCTKRYSLGWDSLEERPWPSL